jgi:hypothetical protein
MGRGPDIRFITGCLPVIAFLALAGWGFNHFIMAPKMEAQRRSGPANAREMAARAAVRADLQLDVRPSGRVYVSGQLGNASPHNVKHVIVLVTYGTRGGPRTASINLGAIGPGQSRAVQTRLPGVSSEDVDTVGGVRVTVSDVRLVD